LNEEQLLASIKADPQQFGQVYEAFHGRILGYAFRRTMDYEVACDIAAETFLKAFSNIDRFRWRQVSILYWLYRIATNELNQYFSRRQYAPQSLCRIQEEYGMEVVDHAGAETEHQQLQQELDKHRDYVRMAGAIRRMDTKYGEVIALRYFENRSIKEIALILDKKEGTVKSLLSRGIDQLKQTLNG